MAANDDLTPEEEADLAKVLSIREARVRKVDRVKRRLEARRIDRDFPPQLSLVKADASLLEQALVNLLDNAIKFNRPSGEVRIEARCDREGPVTITVTDTGIGIASEDLSRIFERFYRVDKAHSRAVGGTGLGLSIVKHVVERMNGKITVTSKLGKGTVFSLTVPACHVN